jgi:hypothetical protein
MVNHHYTSEVPEHIYQESSDSLAKQVKSAFDFIISHKAPGEGEFWQENVLVLNIHCTWLMWHFAIFSNS